MSVLETEEKNFPESVMGRETPPTHCVMESKKEDCNGSNCMEQQQKTDQGQLKRCKGKLIRSAAVCDEPLPTESSSKESESECDTTADNAGSSECEEEEQEKQECSTQKKPSLSKESSLEYTDSTGIDLEEFLITTLKSSPRDRLMLLKLEKDMTDFMTDNSSYKKFPQMSSYHRMLVHRVAAYFGLEHNVDHSGKAVIINKTSNSRIPEQRFAEHVQEEKTEERRSILQRDNSQEKEDLQMRVPLLKEQMKSKSIEEREEEYQRVRDRIFSQDASCPPKSVYIETRGPEECCNMYSETQRRRQLFRSTRDGSGQLSGSRQSSLELECYWNDPQPWSSTDSDSSTWTSKPTHSRTDSSSKLGKSEAAAASGSLPGAPPSNSPAYILVPPESSILPGSILINPHTGQPYLNPDGTPAVYNPPASKQSLSSQLNTMQPQAPLPPHQQQPVTSHGVPQVQYSPVTYLPPQQVVTTSQLYPPEQCTSMYSYPMQCPNTLQQYGPLSYNTQTGYAVQQQAYPSMVGTQVLPQTQQPIMGSYSSTSSYQMASQLQSYPSTVLVSRQAGQSQSAVPQAGVSVYCTPLPPSPPSPGNMLGTTCQSSSCRNACNRNQYHCWY
ncbi:cAMP-regulated phosphoprotein 21 isoform X4 [Pygocentrus nattereri]|uniref:cAMP-regulated phosphoprotein 21 isoform X4 n=1 Tax=Pygocentrus nattereri TaxID=42514 RepID=UPI0008148A84|nr:cAMP-regulated phosphoprotein 21 isoform X4 [Pygocentrus nattereri]